MNASAVSFKRFVSPLIVVWLVVITGLIAAGRANAGVTLEVRVYRFSENGYVFYTPLVTNSTPPAATQGFYVISSPKRPASGSWRLLELSGGNDFQTVTGSESVSGSFSDLMDDITNGFWNLTVTNATSTNSYQFRVNVGTIISNCIPLVQVTSPTGNANHVAKQPLFTWTGPTSWAGTADVFDLWRPDENSNWNYETGASLPGSQTSWPCPVELPDGENYFNVTYRTNSTSFFSASVPTNNVSQSIPGWAVNSYTESFSDVYFNVGQPSSAFDLFLVARYNFENPGSPGTDTSGNGNNNNCSGSSGNNPVYDDASTDSAIGTYARHFYGDSWICLTDGGNAFHNLSNAISQNFSVTAWVKTTSSAGSDSDDADSGMAILYADDFGDSHALPLSITGSKAAFTIRDSNGDPTTVHSTTDVNDGNYHFLAVTRNRTTGLMQIYVDGNLEDSATATTDDLIAGTYFDIASGNYNYTGLLDDLRIYSTNLSAGDVAALFGGPTGITLAEALDTTNLTWTTGGDASWLGQTAISHDGSDAARSGSITNDESTWIETTVVGPGTLSFWWRVSSEQDFDYLEFLIDGDWQDDLSGDSGWLQQTYSISAGSHTLRWNYYKDGSDSDHLDSAFLDQVSFVATQTPVITYQPVDVTNYSGYVVTLLADADSTPEASWQWYKVGSGAIPGATSRFYSPTNSGSALVAGSYYALASNASGSSSTRTALVSYVSATLPPDWSKAFQVQLTGNFDNPRTNYGIATLVDASGNVYSANSLSGTNYFTTNTFVSGPGRFAAGLFKHTASGTALWGNVITNNGNGNSYPQCLAHAPGDGVYMSGVFLGTNQISTNVLQETAGASLYLARFDAAGNVLWVRTFGGTNAAFQSYHQLVSDLDGNVTISALGNNLVSFGSTNVVLNGQRGVLAQYDANGNLRWISQPSGWISYMTSQAGRIYALMGGSDTNYIGGITNVSDRKYALAAINGTNGQALWLQGLGSAANADNPNNVSDVPALAVAGADLFVTGVGLGSGATFGAFTTSWSGPYGQYFARFNTNGTAQLATNFGGTNTWVWAAAADAAGNVYVSGDFDGYSRFGDKLIGGPRLGGIGNNYPSQMYIAKFDRNGNSLWVKQAQSEVSTSFVNVRDLAVTSDGVWSCGFVNYYANFGTNIANRVYGPVTIIGFPFGYIYYWVGGYLAKVSEAGIVTPPLAVTLLSPQSSGANFQFQFQSQSGYSHAVQYRTNLVTGQNWQTYSNVTGDGGVKVIGVPQSLFSPAQQGFIRISTQ